MAVATLSSNAQNYKNDGKPYTFYCELTAYQNMTNKLRIYLTWPGKRSNQKLRDENGNKIEFSNVIDCIDYLSKRGWQFDSVLAYGNTLHYLMKKEVTTDAEAKEGLIFKDDTE